LYEIFVKRTSSKHKVKEGKQKKTKKRKRKRILGIAQCKGKRLEKKRKKESN